jgi:signal transduction histidine kinase
VSLESGLSTLTRNTMPQLPLEPLSEPAERSDSLPGACQLPVEAAADHLADLSSMCHELRTPMNIVVGMAWLLQHSGLNPVQQNYLREIQGASDQLLRIVNQLLGDARAGLGVEPLWSCGALDFADNMAEANDPTAARESCGQELDDPCLDAARWTDLRLQLMALLRAADTDCIRLAREHRSLLRVMFGSEYEAWAQALADFDFESALPLIEVQRTGPSV